MLQPQHILCFPAAYRLFRHLLGAGSWETYIRDHLRPESGMRVLDIGCGPGDILAYLPAVDYLGVDICPEYIEAAKSRYQSRASFRCESVVSTTIRDPGTFDLVMANGLLHHLNDEEACQLFAVAAQALCRGGRLVTWDGCFADGQSPVARWLLRRDRGRFVRTEAAYVRLATEHFTDVRGAIRHDLLRLPYTHFIMDCRFVRGPEGGRSL